MPTTATALRVLVLAAVLLLPSAAAAAASATPWPLPLNLTRLGAASSVTTIDPSFTFTCSPAASCSPAACAHPIVAAAFGRYELRIRPPPSPTPSPPPSLSPLLTSVTVCISSAADSLGPDTDEAYHLHVRDDGAGTLDAATMFGMCVPVLAL